MVVVSTRVEVEEMVRSDRSQDIIGRKTGFPI